MHDDSGILIGAPIGNGYHVIMADGTVEFIPYQKWTEEDLIRFKEFIDDIK